MATFAPGIDTAVAADEPFLDVLASASNPLPAGRHVFQLVVTDNAGLASPPATIAVLVRDRSRPTAVIDFVREDGTRSYTADVVVPWGRPFRLTGERSTDSNGHVRVWRWTLLS